MIAFDTNVLVYAVDGGAGERHEVARRLLRLTLEQGTLLLPLQAIGEFGNIARRKLGLPSAEASAFIESWAAIARIEPYGIPDIVQALRTNEDHKISFWDALIWAVCERAGVDLLVSEDFQNRRRLGRVTVLDPFDPANAGPLGLT